MHLAKAKTPTTPPLKSLNSITAGWISWIGLALKIHMIVYILIVILSLLLWEGRNEKTVNQRPPFNVTAI